MKTILFLMYALAAISSEAQITAIPDFYFEQALIDQGYDSGIPDGSVPTASIDTITILNISSSMITDMTGIEDFNALEVLHCQNNEIDTLDLSGNPQLQELDCAYSYVEYLDINNCPDLIYLYCYGNLLTTIDLSGNPNLAYFNCSDNYNLDAVNLSACPSLLFLSCSSCPMTSLDVSQNTALKSLICYELLLAGLDVGNNPLLETLLCDMNLLTAIDLSNNPALVSLSIHDNELVNLDVSMLPNLLTLDCTNNNLQCLNLKNGNNTASWGHFMTGNPDLTCIEVDDPAWAATNWTDIDAGASFSSDCACSVAGLDDDQSAAADIYPIPLTSDILYLKGVSAETDYHIYSSAGQFIRSGTVTGQRIDMSGLGTGVYLLILENESMDVRKKLVIN